jgi:hypothetical protein
MVVAAARRLSSSTWPYLSMTSREEVWPRMAWTVFGSTPLLVRDGQYHIGRRRNRGGSFQSERYLYPDRGLELVRPEALALGLCLSHLLQSLPLGVEHAGHFTADAGVGAWTFDGRLSGKRERTTTRRSRRPLTCLPRSGGVAMVWPCCAVHPVPEGPRRNIASYSK